MGAGGKAVLAICNFIDTKEKVVRGFQSTEGSRDIAHLISEGAASGVRLEEGHRAQGLLGRRPEETAESSTASQIQQRGISIKKKKNLVFPGGPVVKTPCFQWRECSLDPRLGN